MSGVISVIKVNGVIRDDRENRRDSGVRVSVRVRVGDTPFLHGFSKALRAKNPRAKGSLDCCAPAQLSFSSQSGTGVPHSKACGEEKTTARKEYSNR